MGKKYISRVPPNDDALIAQARLNSGGWVYDLDYEYSRDDFIPPEAIKGAWEVSPEGTLTGRYRENERYRHVEICDRKLPPYVHAAARHNPGKWISEIAPEAEHLFPNIPDEFIRGWWLVGDDGKISSRFRPNSLYATTLL